MKPLTKSALGFIAQATYRKTASTGLEHAQLNASAITQTVADMDSQALPGETAVVVAAGPSLTRHRIADRIRSLGYGGTIVATDGGLGYCLRHGIIPHVVVSVDPHSTRIVRWFGDPELNRRPPDDYFRRQDLDPHLTQKEQERNDELSALVDRHGPRIRALLSTSVAPTVTRRVRQAGLPIYWWNPIYDDYDDPQSYTRRIFELTKAPCIVTGGNCGTAAWVLAGAVLGRREVAVVGMDLGYPPETPLEHTQYYQTLHEVFGSAAHEAYIQVQNPYLNESWFTDPTYWWYRESFLDLAQRASFRTSNCTGGGVLFGDHIRWESLETFVERNPC